MIIGKLNILARLERKVVTKDSYGQDVESWQHEARMWIGVVPANGRESFTGDRPVSSTPIIIEARYRDGIGPDHRIVRGSIVYNIHSVEEVELRRKVRLTCSAEELKTAR